MSMATKYVRKPFEVEAVRVTQANLDKAAEWCGGEIKVETGKSGDLARQYIKVNVRNPIKERQTKAFVGDYILLAGNSFKVYTSRSFNLCFEEQESKRVDESKKVDAMLDQTFAGSKFEQQTILDVVSNNQPHYFGFPGQGLLNYDQ